MIQYQSLINIAGTSGHVHNKVSISGTNVQEQTQENNSSVFVAVSSGGGSGSGERGSLTILKTGKAAHRFLEQIFNCGQKIMSGFCGQERLTTTAS